MEAHAPAHEPTARASRAPTWLLVVLPVALIALAVGAFVLFADDTLPERWFEEPNPSPGAYHGEKIDRAEFDTMLSRFYEISQLTNEGIPIDAWRRELESALAPTA